MIVIFVMCKFYKVFWCELKSDFEFDFKVYIMRLIEGINGCCFGGLR